MQVMEAQHGATSQPEHRLGALKQTRILNDVLDRCSAGQYTGNRQQFSYPALVVALILRYGLAAKAKTGPDE